MVKKTIRMKAVYEMSEEDIKQILKEWCESDHVPVREITRSKVTFGGKGKGKVTAKVVLEVREKERTPV